MLNISKLTHKPNITKHYKKGNKIAQTRHYPPANKEWFNSIYAYNKNTIKLLPVADKVTHKALKSYFNLYSSKMEKNIKSPRIRRRLRRLSTNRILISRPELKHTSNKVIIDIYFYNRQKFSLIKKLRKAPFIDHKTILSMRDRLKYLPSILSIIKKNLSYTICRGSEDPSYILDLELSKERQEYLIKKPKLFYDECCERLEKLRSISDKKRIKDCKIFISKCLQREIILFYYRQIISLNKFKFEKTYLLPLTAHLKTIYNKKIEFNLINLKHLYLNSSIFSETLLTKIRNKNNRVLKVLKASLRMFQLASLNNLTIFDDMYNRKKKLQNSKVNYLKLDKNINSDKIKNFISVMQNNQVQTISTTNSVLDSIKNKSITGIRIEASGRLTRRNVAARSIHKLRYKGNLKNMDSSYKGLSSVLLRGHAKSNVQYTKLKSKLRIGSFGLKGWVSSN